MFWPHWLHMHAGARTLAACSNTSTRPRRPDQAEATLAGAMAATAAARELVVAGRAAAAATKVAKAAATKVASEVGPQPPIAEPPCIEVPIGPQGDAGGGEGGGGEGCASPRPLRGVASATGGGAPAPVPGTAR